MRTIKSQFITGIVLFFFIGLATGFWIASVYAKAIVDAAMK